MGVKCFMVTLAMRETRHLRRYSHGDSSKCPHGYHNADGPILDTVPVTIKEGNHLELVQPIQPDPPKDDPRWPRKCDHCEYQFCDADEFQVFGFAIYVDDQGKEYTLRDKVPGMMWDAWWNHDVPEWCGPDGKSLQVVCPDGHVWCIDSRASNCDQKNEHTHKCWVRHGESPNLTVDKNGHTCNAGGGSIQTGSWHGFLRNGELVVC